MMEPPWPLMPLPSSMPHSWNPSCPLNSKMKGSRQPTRGMSAGGRPRKGCSCLVQVTRFVSPATASETEHVCQVGSGLLQICLG